CPDLRTLRPAAGGRAESWVQHASTAPAAASAAGDPMGPGPGPPSRSRACAPCAGRTIASVEIECLKMTCSWLLVSSTTEYLSNERILPLSFTPLSRYRVIGTLSLRAVFRNES